MAARKASPHVQRKDAAALQCYGCAHASALEPPPGKPSGERPCCACVRNPEREEWAKDALRPRDVGGRIVVDDMGNARIFDAYEGTAYNGTPMIYHPMDRYVTLDQHDQQDWLEHHPEYDVPVTFDVSGRPLVVKPRKP